MDCNECGQDHEPPMCVEYTVVVESVDFSPTVTQCVYVPARNEKEAVEIVEKWTADDFAVERWTLEIGNAGTFPCVLSFEDIDVHDIPTPDKFTIISAEPSYPNDPQEV